MNTDFKARLREMGLSQKQAASDLGVSEATLSQWLAALRTGENTRVPAERAKSLASLLKVPPAVIRPDLWSIEAAA